MFGFELPFALFGLLGAGLPILAHLMKRRDLPVFALPTIALLVRARAQSQRKRRLVELLLLLVRAGLLMLIALAVAKPYLSTQTAFKGSAPVSVVAVVDDSMSMTQGTGTLGTALGADTLLEQARTAVEDLAGQLPPHSELSVVLASSPGRTACAMAEDIAQVLACANQALVPSARGTDLSGAVTVALRELAGARRAQREVHLFTDAAGTAPFDDLAKPQGTVRLKVHRVGDDDETSAPANWAITRAQVTAHADLPDRLVLDVDVRRFRGSRGVDTAEMATPTARVEVGGDVVAQSPVELEGDKGHVQFDLPREDALNSARITLHWPTGVTENALTKDDERYVWLRPSERKRLLIVNGAPGPRRDADEVGMLTQVLDLLPRSERFEYQTIDAASLRTAPLATFDLVVLANVPSPDGRTARRLEAFVRDGGGLFVALGDQVHARAFGDRLSAVLPAHLDSHEPLSPSAGLTPSTRSEPLLPFAQSGLSRVRVSHRFPLRRKGRGTRTALRFADGQPALVFGQTGRGRTALFASTLDTAWTDLPLRPGFLPFVGRVLHYLSGGARPSAPGDTVTPGSAVVLSTTDSERQFVVQTPAGQRRPVGPGQAFSDTDAPGTYRVVEETSSGELLARPRLSFVVAPPAEESDLRRSPLPEITSTEEAVRDTEERRTPLLPFALLAFGVLFLIEGWLRRAQPLKGETNA